MPGCPRRSKISARSLAEAKTTSIESGIWTAGGIEHAFIMGQAELAALKIQRTRMRCGE